MISKKREREASENNLAKAEAESIKMCKFIPGQNAEGCIMCSS